MNEKGEGSRHPSPFSFNSLHHFLGKDVETCCALSVYGLNHLEITYFISSCPFRKIKGLICLLEDFLSVLGKGIRESGHPD